MCTGRDVDAARDKEMIVFLDSDIEVQSLERESLVGSGDSCLVTEWFAMSMRDRGFYNELPF
jgi:hypothetical protein